MTLHPDDAPADRAAPAPEQRRPYAAPDPFAAHATPVAGPPPSALTAPSAPAAYGGAPAPATSASAPLGYGQPAYGQPTYGQPAYGQPGHGAPAGPPQAWGAPHGWSGPQGGGWPGAGPGTALRAAAGSARAASVLCWVLLLPWLLLLAGGTAYLASDDPALTDAQYDSAVGTGDGATGFGVLLLLGLGAALWAVLATWSGRTARAAGLAGNGSRSSRAGWAWWGLFVPGASAVLPLLAYREAAAYVTASHRTGGPGQGWGDGWRREPVPHLLTTWWVLAVVAGALVVAGTTTFDLTGSGWAWVLAGLVGGASAVCGALALRRLAAVTDRCAERSWG